jgi:hypothetical protein
LLLWNLSLIHENHPPLYPILCNYCHRIIFSAM